MFIEIKTEKFSKFKTLPYENELDDIYDLIYD